MAPKVHVTIVTLDNHLSGAAERAGVALAKDGIAIHFHAAADWHDAAELERAKVDIARGDIVIATMLFLEDHIRAVMPALEARRESCDAMVGLMSDGDVVKLTRLGGYRMPSSGLTRLTTQGSPSPPRAVSACPTKRFQKASQASRGPRACKT